MEAMPHLKTQRTMRMSQLLRLPVVAMLGLGLLTGCYTGNIAASGDRIPAEPAPAESVSTQKMAPAAEPLPPEQPMKGTLTDTARARNVGSSQALPHTSSQRSSAHQQPNYEYHKDDVLSAPPEARNGPRWDERLQPEYQRRLSRIDDTVYDIRQRSQLEQLRRENAQRESDKASRTPSRVDNFRRDGRDASGFRY